MPALEQAEENRNSVKLYDERKSHIIADPMARDLDTSVAFSANQSSFMLNERSSVFSRKDEDILSNILNFVSTHIPSLKMDNFTVKERERYFSWGLKNIYWE